MKTHHNLMCHVLKHGIDKSDRTGTGTRSVFGYQMHFDSSKSFPLSTTRKLHLRSIIYELLQFLEGDTNTRYLKGSNVLIWDEWTGENGDLDPVCGYQRRGWSASDGRHIDRVANMTEQIKKSPDSCRSIVSAWNPTLVDEMALPPRHMMFQSYVADGKLSCQPYRRSVDIFLDVLFGIVSYAFLTIMMAQACRLKIGELIHTFDDAHFYNDHTERAKLQLSRDFCPLPGIKIDPEVKDLFTFKFEDFELAGYNPHPHIKAKVAAQKSSLTYLALP